MYADVTHVGRVQRGSKPTVWGSRDVMPIRRHLRVLRHVHILPRVHSVIRVGMNATS